jgi:glyoxylase-like metal-dependent hydrolase (beta-lactamase superfamily II)
VFKFCLITQAFCSHAHWDHVFPVKDQLPNATFICGAGTLNIMKDHGYWPKNKESEYDERIWNPKHSELPIKELPPSPTASASFPQTDKWGKLGTFEKALDFFGDGSFYLIDTPGHLAGNISALCRARTQKGETRWILLAGDCFHSHHFVGLPDTPFGTISLVPSGCIHVDPETARDTIRRISALRESDPRVRVWAAHAGLLEGYWEFPKQ